MKQRQDVEVVRDQLSTRAQGREMSIDDGRHILKESDASYSYHFSAQMASLSD